MIPENRLSKLPDLTADVGNCYTLSGPHGIATPLERWKLHKET
jgi:hypothetical protein